MTAYAVSRAERDDNNFYEIYVTCDKAAAKLAREFGCGDIDRLPTRSAYVEITANASIVLDRLYIKDSLPGRVESEIYRLYVDKAREEIYQLARR